MEEKQSAEATIDSDASVTLSDRLHHAAQVEEFLQQFDALPPADRRAAMANVFGIDPDKAVIVRRPDGDLEMREVSASSRAKIESMARQGFQAASFTNRKERRRHQALERDENRRKARLQARARPTSGA